MPIDINGYEIDSFEARQHQYDGIVRGGLVLQLDAGIFNKVTGTMWYDLSGNSNSGTLTNGPTFNSGNGGSIVFDGSNDRLTSSGVQSFGNETTWSIWVNRTSSVNSYNMFMGRYLPYFAFNSSNIIHFSNNISGSQRNVYSTGFTGSNGVWYFLTFTTTYNGSSTTMSIYINGTFNNSASYTGAQANYGTSYNFSVGDGRDTATWYPYYGKVGSCTIYNRALSSTEITQNYNVLKGRYGL